MGSVLAKWLLATEEVTLHLIPFLAYADSMGVLADNFPIVSPQKEAIFIPYLDNGRFRERSLTLKTLGGLEMQERFPVSQA